MANSYTGIFPTIVAALDDAQKALQHPNKLIESVYTDFSATTAGLFDTINLNIPASTGSVTNVGAGSLTFTDVTATPSALQLNQHPAYGFALPDYDTMRSMNPMQVRMLFVDEAVKKIENFINAYLAGLITAGNVANVVAGASNDTITFTEATSMWKTLAGLACPVSDLGNVFLLCNPAVFGSLLADTNWTANSQVGYQLAGEIRRTAMLGQALGVLADYDLDMPVATGVYTSLMFHRNAFALGARALEAPTAGGVAAMQYIYKGIPIRITIDWNQTKLAYTITFDALFGAIPFRCATHACRHTST